MVICCGHIGPGKKSYKPPDLGQLLPFHIVWDSICMPPMGLPPDVGMPLTWEKGSHLPPRTTKLGKLRMVTTPPQLPLLNQIWDPLLSKKVAEVWSPIQGCQKCDGSTLGVGTGTLDGLADSHVRLAIYPTHTIHY